jgi:hypothetical protein
MGLCLGPHVRTYREKDLSHGYEETDSGQGTEGWHSAYVMVTLLGRVFSKRRGYPRLKASVANHIKKPRSMKDRGFLLNGFQGFHLARHGSRAQHPFRQSICGLDADTVATQSGLSVALHLDPIQRI